MASAARAPLISVVVADDHAQQLERLTRTLDEHPDLMVVGCASDGRAALELIDRTAPDVALLDVAMPHLSGVDVAVRLRARGRGPAVLLISASREEASLAARAAGMADLPCLSKQSSRIEICDAVAAAPVARQGRS